MTARRPRPPEDVAFPVTPMLDMAFQLLAFFVLTFRVPSREVPINLYLPTVPASLPSGTNLAAGSGSRAEDDVSDDLTVRIEADGSGRGPHLRLDGAPVADAGVLGDRLRRYKAILGVRPLRVRLEAPDRLPYGEAARVIGACSAAGVDSIRLSDPARRPGR